jgi:hypothetical protein
MKSIISGLFAVSLSAYVFADTGYVYEGDLNPYGEGC